MLFDSNEARSVNSELDRFKPKRGYPKDGIPRRGRGKEFAPEMRVLIGALAKISGPTATARAFGTDPNRALLHAHGKVNQGDEPREELVEGIDKTLAPIRKSAIDKLQMALDAITEDKINTTKSVKDVSAVAANLSRIVEKTAPIKEKAAVNGGIAVHIYRPEMKSEEDYKVIDA